MVSTHNKYNLEDHEADVDGMFISKERDQKVEIEEVNDISAQGASALSRVDHIWVLLSLSLFM